MAEILRPIPPWKLLAALALIALFCATVEDGWTVTVVIAPLVLVPVLEFFTGGPYLKLDRDAFEVRSYSKTWRCPWQNVAMFDAIRPFGLSWVVAFRMKEGFEDSVQPPALVRYLDMRTVAVFGAGGLGSHRDGLIPGNYGMPPPAIAELLEEYRQGRTPDVRAIAARHAAAPGAVRWGLLAIVGVAFATLVFLALKFEMLN